ncbi:prepilin peptidase [Chitinasiproducens palmae]|uniref:Prepilin leader peptidase/N-methyltransferase n=1 Tax=Chitinasiproducens palmae TaxID=1770053 RepID=A0A1H2PJN1_9BURK|nr:A24 family peptidase [Chitinasiproducens palmae]SDV46553.1 leader peptidase (prepilin peptidase) / N-methyltransferase [Chitinasiproducens palmae]
MLDDIALTFASAPGLAWLRYATAFWFGAIAMSFAGVVVDRLPHQLGWRDDPMPGLSIVRPASRCDGCGHRVGWLRLLPVLGYFFAKGRCGHCGMRVRLRYPTMEVAGGLLACASVLHFGTQQHAVWAAALWLVLLFLAWIDACEQWLPAVVTLPLFWTGLLASPFEPDIWSRAVGGALGFGATWAAMALTSRLKRIDAFAGGDVALVSAAGAWLGWTHLPMFLILAALGFLVYALPARRSGRVWMPFGPALSLSFALCLL